jgi:hypothetical protein
MEEEQFTLGIDLACSASHVATLADAGGRLVWSNYPFRTAEWASPRIVEDFS